MTNTESETANKAEYLKARLHDTAASGATAFVTLAIMVAPRKSPLPRLVWRCGRSKPYRHRSEVGGAMTRTLIVPVAQ